ncbi:DUF6284 family protein [Streptomyces xanthochromogenes]|uniref:DUF6284 family protein n=1 Tax=Streptomyces xanthochromogenes TaxID=67384 RepID=UPI00343D6B99
MKYIAALQTGVTGTLPDTEPTPAELDAIDIEMPLILARVELLDAQIITLDRTPNELDTRRIRRARRKVLNARRDFANRTAPVHSDGAA